MQVVPNYGVAVKGQARLKKKTCDKHASLFGGSVNDDEKRFINSAAEVQLVLSSGRQPATLGPSSG
jgi:hypothetical protein